MNLRNYLTLVTALLALWNIPKSVEAQGTTVAGTVQGVVTDDSSGNPIRGAFIGFLSVRPTPTLAWRGGFAITDSLGRYSTKLDTGTYFAIAVKLGYFPEWYDNVRTRDSATALTVSNGGTLEADFKLHRIPPPVLVSVSGTVTDSVSGLPLSGALVAFARPFHWEPVVTPLFSPKPDKPPSGPGSGVGAAELGNLRSLGWFGWTDSAGKYTAHVPASATLIAGSFKFGYVPEFYDDRSEERRVGKEFRSRT